MEKLVAMYLPITTERVHTYEALARDRDNRMFRATKYANPGLKIDCVYEDYIGGRRKKPDLFRLSMLMEDCKEGRVKLILTYSCKYFTRNSEEALATVRFLLSLPEPVGVYFEYENIYTLDDPDQEKLKEALAHWDYERKLRKRRSELGRRIAHNKPITGEGLILELGGSDE